MRDALMGFNLFSEPDSHRSNLSKKTNSVGQINIPIDKSPKDQSYQSFIFEKEAVHDYQDE